MSSPAPKSRPRLGVEALEDRTVPAFALTGGESIAVGDVFPEISSPTPQNEYVVGAAPGSPPFVRVYALDGTLEAEFLAYEQSFTGGVHVAVGQLSTADPRLEIVTGPGVGGGPLVKVFNANFPVAINPIWQFLAYEASFRGGVNVSTGNFDGDATTQEIVTGSGPGGGPVVKTFTRNGSLLRSFFAYEPTFRFGVNVAGGSVINTGGAPGQSPGDEIVTGPGVGGAPLVKVFNGQSGALERVFFAFDQNARNGLTVAVGDTDNQLDAEIFAAAAFDPSGNTRIRSFQGQDAGQIESDFLAFPTGYTHSINMAVGDVAGAATKKPIPDSYGDLVVVSAEPGGEPVPRVYFGLNNSPAGLNGP